MKTTRELQPRVRACANAHHNLLLENLLWDCKELTINTSEKQKQTKETNWKQKFQKPKNENICLTSVNTAENKWNFHFMSFGTVFLKVQNQLLWTSLSFQHSGWKMASVGKLCTKSGLFKWHFIVFSMKIQRNEQLSPNKNRSSHGILLLLHQI